jgi:hypothetical protein
MGFTPLAFMELFVVLAFLIGWIIVEYVARRSDKRRDRYGPSIDADDRQ